MEQVNDSPIDSIELTGMMIDPDKDNILTSINRNDQLGYIKHKEAYFCQSLEEHALVVENIPSVLGGNIFKKWGRMARLKKHHFLVLSGSRAGFVRRMEKTRINKDEQRLESDNVFSKLFSPKSKKGEY